MHPGRNGDFQEVVGWGDDLAGVVQLDIAGGGFAAAGNGSDQDYGPSKDQAFHRISSMV
jgi:hypothetical protein